MQVIFAYEGIGQKEAYMQAKKFKKDINHIYDLALKQTLKPQNVRVNLVFVGTEEIRQMNKKYRGVDSVTDVLSFPMLDDFADFEREIDFASGDVEIGDIYINMTRAKEQAQDYGHSLKREMCFLALHGMLHLLGFDHIQKEDEEVMFTLQDKIMQQANIGRE